MVKSEFSIKENYAQETVTLQSGQRASSRFNYTTYDPAILVVDLKFQDWQKSGNFVYVLQWHTCRNI